MIPERMRYLEQNMHVGLKRSEIADGWRFCCEWDGMLIHRTDPEADCCGCLREAGLYKEEDVWWVCPDCGSKVVKEYKDQHDCGD